VAFIRLVFRLSFLQIKDKNKTENLRNNNKMDFILKNKTRAFLVVPLLLNIGLKAAEQEFIK